MATLHAISGTTTETRAGDIVFIHGLDGDAFATWQAKEQTAAFWPKWVGEDLPEVGVWSLGYEASSTAWRGSAMALADRATNVLALLEAHELGQRPVVFICHSLGGLLVKQLLRHAVDYGQSGWNRLADQTKAVVFLATPHLGSDLASWLKHVGTFLRSNAPVDDLQANHARLRELNLWFRGHVQRTGLHCQIYSETLRVAKVLVVDEGSSDPGLANAIPIPIDRNHIDICKVASRDELLYVRTLKFIRESLKLVKGAPAGSPGRRQLDEYLFVDRHRLASYCQQFGLPDELNQSAKIAALAREVAKMEDQVVDPLAARTFIMRRALLPKRVKAVGQPRAFAIWIGRGQCLIEEPPIWDDFYETSSYTGILNDLLAELDLGQIHPSGEEATAVTDTSFKEVTFDPRFFELYAEQDEPGRKDMIRHYVEQAVGREAAAGAINIEWESVGPETAHAIELAIYVRNHGTVYVAHFRRNPYRVEGTDAGVFRIRRDPLRELDEQFQQDPEPFLVRYGARVSPPREIDVIYRRRSAWIGYAVVIAASPSSLCQPTCPS